MLHNWHSWHNAGIALLVVPNVPRARGAPIQLPQCNSIARAQLLSQFAKRPPPSFPRVVSIVPRCIIKLFRERGTVSTSSSHNTGGCVVPVGPAQSAQSAQHPNASSPHLGPELATLAQRSPPFIELVVLLVQCALVRGFRGRLAFELK